MFFFAGAPAIAGVAGGTGEYSSGLETKHRHFFLRFGSAAGRTPHLGKRIPKDQVLKINAAFSAIEFE